MLKNRTVYVTFVLANGLYSMKLTHVAAGLDAISSGTDHLVGGQDAPPVVLGAGVMVDHRQERLLQDVSRGTAGCGERNALSSGKKED